MGHSCIIPVIYTNFVCECRKLCQVNYYKIAQLIFGEDYFSTYRKNLLMMRTKKKTSSLLQCYVNKYDLDMYKKYLAVVIYDMKKQ